jgi:DNA polymerase III subunit gamma/tau
MLFDMVKQFIHLVEKGKNMPKNKYEVSDNIAVRYRPKSLNEIIGNIQVKKILKGYFQKGNLPKSLMFIGPTGSGKTTIVRIIAKTINCEQPGDDHSPCRKCSSCIKEIRGLSGHLSIHEVDCTTNGKLDDMRQLIHMSILSPRHKYRVFILDEFQSATREAQKALLKSLEEPPPLTMWILGTSEPDNVLEAIIGRCITLNMKYPSAHVVSKRLKEIAESEFEPPLAKFLFPYLKKIAKICECQPRKSIELLDKIAMALLGSKKALKDTDSAERVMKGFLGSP